MTLSATPDSGQPQDPHQPHQCGKRRDYRQRKGENDRNDFHKHL